ncbi:MAG: DinB family protein [Ginsengibacter sp.]
MNNELLVKMITDSWRKQLTATNKIFDNLSDEELMQEVAPGRNRAIYLLGHLTAVHDRMFPLLGFEESKYPDLKAVFLDSPDKAVDAIPSASELRQRWHDVNETLSNHIKSLPADDWFTRHANISQEDFIKEPHRNRLNVLLDRTVHLSNHRGQLLLLKKGISRH